MAARGSDADTARRELIVTRVLDAPRSLVFEAWTEPRHVVHWWMPEGFGKPDIEKMDVRVGGEWRVRMPFTDGTIYTARGIYREVIKGRRIAWDDYCDENGKYFHKAFVTVNFEDHGAATKVTLRARLEDVPGRDPRWTREIMEKGWVDGWKNNLELLVGYIPVLASGVRNEVHS